MLRPGTRQGLQDLDPEADSCRDRLLALQGEFQKMEETVASMKRYKAKIDQLKQENTNVKLSYEANLQKYCSHISTLERDNILMRNHVKKVEAQIHGKGDDRDKSRLLLERLKMVETENSSLVLENEQQRQHYEKCLDDIANQVVQALLAQKTLREECLKLQSRVQDLEMQNKHLLVMFQQKMKASSDTFLQEQHTFNLAESCVTLSQREMTAQNVDSVDKLQDLKDEMTHRSTTSLQGIRLPSARAKVDSSPHSNLTSRSTIRTQAYVREHTTREKPATNHTAKRTQFKEHGQRARSLEHTLPSNLLSEMITDNCDKKSRQVHSMDFPVPRLKRCSSAGDIYGYGTSTNMSSSQLQFLTGKLPWNNALSGGKPAAVYSRHFLNYKTINTLYRDFPDFFIQNSTENPGFFPLKSVQPSSSAEVRCSSLQSEHYKHSPPLTLTSESGNVAIKNKCHHSAALRSLYEGHMELVRSVDRSKLREELTLSSHGTSKAAVNGQDQLYYYDYSDDDSEGRPVCKELSLASTMSINELLDSSEKEAALNDDFFSNLSSVSASAKKINGPTNSAVVCNKRADTKPGNANSSSSRSWPRCQLSLEAGIPVSRKISSLKPTESKKVIMTCAAEASQRVTTASTAENKSGGTKNVTSQSAEKKRSAPTPVTQEVNDKPLENINPSTINNGAIDEESCGKSDPCASYSGQKPNENFSDENKCRSSPSITSKGQNGSSSDSYSSNERITRVVNRDATGSKLASSGDNSGDSKILTRPGQLILAPEEKNFMFQGFSSASSTSSEDKSPLKIFESKQNCDMRSSVIEVKKDGTFVHAMRSIGDSSSESSKSMSASPSSPVKSPSKNTAPVDNRVSRVLKPESRPSHKVAKDNNYTDQQHNSAGLANRNITVGFIFHNQRFPENTDLELPEDSIKISMSDLPNKNHTGKFQELGNRIPTKCQSSDSSFENLRVERSGSKDDGYSTMSSDIHPEILERFSDTLTRKHSAVHPEHPVCGIKNMVTETYVIQDEVRRNSDPTVNTQDRSFDLTSDPDSALETSVHSTAEMVTSSSSQVSTSSSDFPLSPCSTNVSKMSRLFDVDGTKLRFVRASAINITKDKDTAASPSSKISNSSLSPLSPNSFVPSCYQPPESPRRLANEFHKPNTVVSPGTTATFRKISPSSPKHLNKSFGGFSLKQKEQTSGVPVNLLHRKSLDTKLPSLAKPNVTDSPLPSEQTRLAKAITVPTPPGTKAITVPTPQGTKNKSLSLIKVKVGGKIDNSMSVKCNNVSGDVKSEVAVSRAKSKSENKVKQPSLPPSTKGEEAAVKPIGVGAAVTGERRRAGEAVGGKENPIKTIRQPPTISSTSNTKVTLSTGGKVAIRVQIPDSKDGNSSNHAQAANTACSIHKIASNVPSDSTKPTKSAQNYICLPDSKTIKYKQNAPAPLKPITSSSRDSENHGVAKIHIPSRPSNLSTKKSSRTSSDSASQAALTTSAVPCDIPSSQSQLNHHQHSGRTTEHQTMSTSAEPMQRQCGRILLTNNGFQHISDSENNEDDNSASMRPLTAEDIIKEDQHTDTVISDIIKENQHTNMVISDYNNTDNIKQVNCNVQTSNIPTTNTPLQQQMPDSATSERDIHMPNERTDLTHLQTLPSADAAHENQSSSVSTRQPVQHRYYRTAPPMTLSLSSNKVAKAKTSNKPQCLHRSLSESDLYVKFKTRSIYSQCLWATWDCGRVLGRCASAREIDVFSQRSWPFGQGENSNVSCFEIQSRGQTRLPSHYRHRHNIFPAPSPPSTFVFPSNIHNLQRQHHQQHQYHYQVPRIFSLKSFQSAQSDELNELNELGSELSTYCEFLSSSHLDLTSDDSPRTDVEEQKEFNSQFYSLCKVDSNRSLLSSGNESRERLPEAILNEGKSLKSSLEITAHRTGKRNGSGMDNSRRNIDVEKVIDVEEFEEISRQIVSLSKTVEELNQSLASFNSGDFKLPACSKNGTHPLCDHQSASRPDLIEGYHWANDGMSMISCSREYIIGGFNVVCDASLAQMCSQLSPLDQSNTEDASNEFCQVSFRKQGKPLMCRSLAGQDEIFAQQGKPLMCRSLAGQDEIFAQTLFDTVKGNPQAKRQQQLWPPGVGDEVVSDVPGDTEGKLPKTVFRKLFQNEDTGQEGGENGAKDGKDEESRPRQVSDEQGSELTDKLVSSNNESDDSLASDIGLDRMMCQRLFGRKDCFRSSSKQDKAFADATIFCGCREASEIDDVPVSYHPTICPDSGNKIIKTQKGLCVKGKESSLPSVESVDSEDDIRVDDTWKPHVPCSVLPGDKSELQTRDVGIDAMSQSQISMDASFEVVDQLFPESDTKEALLESPQLGSEQDRNVSMYQASSIETNNAHPDIDHSNDVGKEQKRVVNSDDLYMTSTQSCLALKSPQSHSLTRQTRQNKPTAVDDLASYSEFIADLQQPCVSDEAAPPKIPPRQPIFTNTRRLRCPERDIAPLPPPPICLNNEVHPPSRNQHHRQQHPPHHFPYVNQFIPSLTFQNSGRYKPGKSKDTFVPLDHHCSPIACPPPLPPRLPHASSYPDNIPQDNTRTCRANVPKGNFNERPQFLTNYLLGKSKSALPSHSALSNLATYPGPRSHSDKRHHFNGTSSTEKPVNENTASRIPRRRLKTRRDRSKSRLHLEKQSVDANAKSAVTNSSSPSCKQWRDINVVSGQPISDNSCEDTSS